MVKQIALGMANAMKTMAMQCTPKAIQVTDGFHVQKIALEAVQEIRITHRWEDIELDT